MQIYIYIFFFIQDYVEKCFTCTQHLIKLAQTNFSIEIIIIKKNIPYTRDYSVHYTFMSAGRKVTSGRIANNPRFAAERQVKYRTNARY